MDSIFSSHNRSSAQCTQEESPSTRAQWVCSRLVLKVQHSFALKLIRSKKKGSNMHQAKAAAWSMKQDDMTARWRGRMMVQVGASLQAFDNRKKVLCPRNELEPLGT
eukprot:1141190-Pelagomonas_calceolata.AAC.2